MSVFSKISSISVPVTLCNLQRNVCHKNYIRTAVLIENVFPLSLQMNDYIAAYHDAVLLVGQVMRNISAKNLSEIENMEYVNANYFRNISFNGEQGGGESWREGDRK